MGKSFVCVFCHAFRVSISTGHIAMICSQCSRIFHRERERERILKLEEYLSYSWDGTELRE